MSLNFYLQKIMTGGSLTEFEAAGACEILLQQESSSAPAGGLLTALQLRGESTDEIVGFAQNLKKQVEPVAIDAAPLTDIACTVPSSLPVVTLGAALLLATSGAKVAKLLMRDSDSREIDLLPQLGLNNVSRPNEIRRQMQSAGIGFINISQHLPRIRAIRAHQEALGVSQIFDWIMPLAHPAKISSLLMGIDRPASVATLAQAMRRLRLDRGVVMASTNGATCPFSAPGTVQMAELKNGRITCEEISAADFGLNIPDHLSATLPANTVAQQVGWLRAFADRRPSPITDAIRWTTACAMLAAGRADSLPEALNLTDETIKSGRLASIMGRLETGSPYAQVGS